MGLDYSLNTNAAARNVTFFYIDESQQLNLVNMESNDNVNWYLAKNASVKLEYFSYLINNHFWVCRPDFQLEEINGVLYNNANKALLHSRTHLVIEKSLTCKNFLEPDFEPYLESNIFTNMDEMFGFWC